MIPQLLVIIYRAPHASLTFPTRVCSLIRIVNSIYVPRLSRLHLDRLSARKDQLPHAFHVHRVGFVRRTQGRRRPEISRSRSRATEAVTGSTSVQWNIAQIGADKCWALGVDGSGIVAATIDGGVNYQHDALVANYRGTLALGGFNHTFNWNDFAYQNPEPLDEDGHGTNVAGVLSASASSGVGVGTRYVST
jgi:subtilisin family serine protease